MDMLREPALAYHKRNMTVEEYLEMENAAGDKHEYYQGEVFAMSGAKLPHNRVVTNLFIILGQKLKGQPCLPYGSDMRIHVPQNTLFTYPDISVICGEPESLNNDELNFTNPTLLIEVLSPSTSFYDRGTKFMLYRDIPSLKEYILPDPTTKTVESWFINQSGHWEQRQYSVDGILQIHSLDINIPLADIFEGVK